MAVTVGIVARYQARPTPQNCLKLFISLFFLKKCLSKSFEFETVSSLSLGEVGSFFLVFSGFRHFSYYLSVLSDPLDLVLENVLDEGTTEKRSL